MNKLIARYKALDQRIKNSRYGQWQEKHKKIRYIALAVELFLLAVALLFYHTVMHHHH